MYYNKKSHEKTLYTILTFLGFSSVEITYLDFQNFYYHCYIQYI